jgi:hypothetical protein
MDAVSHAAGAVCPVCTHWQALREEVHRMMQRDPGAKALVFSQFTSMLELCYHRLEQVACLFMYEIIHEHIHTEAGFTTTE